MTLPNSRFYIAPGVYTASVRSVRDAQLRFRFGVIVHGVHSPTMPDEDLPKAELITPVRGAYAPLMVGDQVLVVFVENDQRYPAIIGLRSRGDHPGVPSTPIDYQMGQIAASTDTSELNKSLKRIQHIDSIGNLLELSEVGGESRVRMKSGGAEVFVSMEGDTAVVTSTGKVVINAAGPVQVTGGTVDVSAQTVNIESRDTDLLMSDAGRTRVMSNKRVTMAAFGDIPTPPGPASIPTGTVDVGAEIQQVSGIPVVPQNASQSASTSLMAQEVNIGVSPGAVLGPYSPAAEAISPGIGAATSALAAAYLGATAVNPLTPWLLPSPADLRAGDLAPVIVPMRPTMNINIMCAANLKIHGGMVDIQAHALSANISAPLVNVTAQQGATVQSNSGDISVTAVLGAINVTALKGATVNAGSAALTLYSLKEVTILAPKINLGA